MRVVGKILGLRETVMQISNAAQSNSEHMGLLIQQFRGNMSAAYKDEVAQLKAAREALKDAYKAGDKAAIDADKQAVQDLEQQIKANRATLLNVHDDVKQMRELRQQLAADVKAKNVDAIQQDRDAFNEAKSQVLTDIQA